MCIKGGDADREVSVGLGSSVGFGGLDVSRCGGALEGACPSFASAYFEFPMAGGGAVGLGVVGVYETAGSESSSGSFECCRSVSCCRPVLAGDISGVQYEVPRGEFLSL